MSLFVNWCQKIVIRKNKLAYRRKPHVCDVQFCINLRTRVCSKQLENSIKERLQYQLMGSIQLPKTLAGWGRYCDCLQNIDKFKVEHSESSQQGQVQNEKALDVPSSRLKSKQKNKIQPVTAESIETPPPIKQSKSIQKKQKHFGPLKVKILGHQTIQQLSQFTDNPPVKDNIFDIVRLEEDDDVKNRHHIIYTNPIYQPQEKKKRATAPNPSDNYFFENQRANNTTYTSKNMQRPTKKYFIDEKDKYQFLDNSKNV